MKYGMMYVCGNSIEELEQSLLAMKMAMATGATMGCGGSSIAEVERGIAMMGGHMPTAEDEDEDVCPYCDDYCENCGYDTDEDEEEDAEPPTISEILHMVADGAIDIDEAYNLMAECYGVED